MRRRALAISLVAVSAAPCAVAGTILDIQTHKVEETVAPKAKGDDSAHLININSLVNAWYLLELKHGDKRTLFNLENPYPVEQRLHLSSDAPGSLIISDYLGAKPCDLWSKGSRSILRKAKAAGMPFATLCDGRVLLRNPVDGHRSVKEFAVDLLRDHIWGGEAVTSFFKETLFKDKYKLVSDVVQNATTAVTAATAGLTPMAALTADNAPPLAPRQLGIRVAAGTDQSLAPGAWYPAQNQAGVWVSEVVPAKLATKVLHSYRDSVAKLDAVEGAATAYFVAFDLNRFDLGFTLGTDHPRVGWSERAPHEAGLAGPDGFATSAPLVQSGMLSPVFRKSVVATFAGGFKRHHGAFKWGELAKVNHGSHYGFIEDGVVFSKLQPGLATLFVKTDGSFGMKTWTEADDEMTSQLRYARQNGVPIIERQALGAGKPTAFVADWARGNWSGSVEKKLRTLRSGLCLQRSGQQRYLIYGYFSTATPNAMARTFQAFGCEYAMHLDMNAPEHTYMALYHGDDADMGVEHLVTAMGAYDGKDGTKTVPRFVGMPDNRDFVFLYKKPNF